MHKNTGVVRRAFFRSRCYAGLALLLLAATGLAQAREFTFQYVVRINAPTMPGEEVRVFLPLAVDDERQQILAESVESSIDGVAGVEQRYGNRYWFGSVEANGEPIEITVKTRIKRQTAAPSAEGQSGGTPVAFLQANKLVPVNHPVLAPILEEIDAAAPEKTSAAYSRAIYDWVVENVEYKKVGSGWGNGDTFWACSERYGNCTDFHSLFISLARSRQIPARFEIGFPIPEDRNFGTVGGYHCWVEAYLPERGWFAIDASEAAKNPSQLDYYYGGRPTNRIHFSTGRDLVLGDEQQTGALNYFIYPHVEIGGEQFKGAITTEFSYEG